MNDGAFEIRSFNLRSASEREYICYNKIKNVLRAETLPEDPPIPDSEAIQRWRNFPEFIRETVQVVWDEKAEKIIALAEGNVYLTEDNQHMMDFYIGVLPEYRRRGFARRLLKSMLAFAQEHKRRLMLSRSNERVPASGEFLGRLGASKGLSARTNQLRMLELDSSLIEGWMEQTGGLLEHFAIGYWDGPYPDEHVEAIAAMIQVAGRDEPKDDLELEDFDFTPEILRQMEQQMFSAGYRRWTIFAFSLDGNHLAGLSEVFWNPNRPAILNQGFTGVMPDYRGRGLGRRMKAEMVTRILRERPEVEVIRTGNANSNVPMLRINNEMGFKPYTEEAIWQVATDAVADYLASAE
jgi:GNAT superfamily N-acetyltransferase